MAIRTAKQKAALRKAQLASARKRRGKGHSKLRRAGGAVGRHLNRNRGKYAVAVGVAHLAYKTHSHFQKKKSLRAFDKKVREMSDRNHARANQRLMKLRNINGSPSLANGPGLQVKMGRYGRNRTRYGRLSVRAVHRALNNPHHVWKL